MIMGSHRAPTRSLIQPASSREVSILRSLWSQCHQYRPILLERATNSSEGEVNSLGKGVLVVVIDRFAKLMVPKDNNNLMKKIGSNAPEL